MDYTDSPETLAQGKTDRVCVISLAVCLVAALGIWGFQTMNAANGHGACEQVKSAAGTAGKAEQAVFLCTEGDVPKSAR